MSDQFNAQGEFGEERILRTTMQQFQAYAAHYRAVGAGDMLRRIMLTMLGMILGAFLFLLALIIQKSSQLEQAPGTGSSGRYERTNAPQVQTPPLGYPTGPIGTPIPFERPCPGEPNGPTPIPPTSRSGPGAPMQPSMPDEGTPRKRVPG